VKRLPSTTTWIKIAVSAVAVAAIVCRLIWPNIKNAIDVIAFGLFVVAVLPWLSSIIESVDFPGGWGVKLRDVQGAGSLVTAGAETKSAAAHPSPRGAARDAPQAEAKAAMQGSGVRTIPLDASEPAFMSIVSRDPNLALVGLRIEIEKRVRQLAGTHGLPDRLPLRKMLNELRRTEILDSQTLQGLDELIMAGNDAAHGATVQDSGAQWAIEYGPKVLAVLDAYITEEKCIKYLRAYHPKVWDRLMVLDEAMRFKFYNLLVEYLQKPGADPSAADVNLLGAFGTDDAELERLLTSIHPD
jgi:hypothetical protein